MDDTSNKCKKTVVYTRVNGALHIENCKNYKKSDYPPAHRLSVNVLLSNRTFFVIFAVFDV